MAGRAKPAKQQHQQQLRQGRSLPAAKHTQSTLPAPTVLAASSRASTWHAEASSLPPLPFRLTSSRWQMRGEHSILVAMCGAPVGLPAHPFRESDAESFRREGGYSPLSPHLAYPVENAGASWGWSWHYMMVLRAAEWPSNVIRVAFASAPREASTGDVTSTVKQNSKLGMSGFLRLNRYCVGK